MRLVLDLETTSTADLRLTGAQAYAEHPETRVTVLCYAIDDEPVVTVTDLGRVHSIFTQTVRGGATIVAHNYLFEFNVYHHKLVPLGWPVIPLRQWSCTMARAYVAGYPGSLELAGKAARIAMQKDTGARDLMLRMARPRTLTPEITWWHETSPEHFKRLCDYCVTDVEAERALDRAVPELSPRERAIFECDHRLNQRGLAIDLVLVDRLAALAEAAKTQLTAKLIRVTNGQVTTPNQVARLREWLAFQGLQTDDLRRNTVRALLVRQDLSKPVREALQARLDASRSSTAKLAAIAAARSPDGRVKGAFQYYGANRTGRWAGRRVQPQNLYRGSIDDVPAAIANILGSPVSPADLEALYPDSAMGVVASCLRSTIIAAPGNRLVIIDLSQIEARVLAWLAGESASLDCFRRGDDIYVDTARRVGSRSRQLGKVLVLACGFGMAAIRFQLTAAGFGLILDLPTCETMVKAWREANKRIVHLWWELHRALLRIVLEPPGAVIRYDRNLTLKRVKGAVLLQLPSGRHLVYRRAHLMENEAGHNEFCYMGSGGGGWQLQRSWPGKIVENVVQAIARDVLCDAMIELDRAGVPLVATVHDELVAEVPERDADRIYTLMRDAMRRAPAWAPDLPMDAAGFIAARYHKPA